MEETTYDIIAKSLDRISAEMQEIGEKNGLSRLSLLGSQTKFIKEKLSRLLWIELPELNDSHKIEAVSKSTTGIFFSPGIFEMDAMRKAFFKRQAKHFFDNEADQQAYIEYTEKEYLEAAVTLKDILFNSKNGTQKANKGCLIEKFEEAMQ
ncbi:phage protein [Streptococcus pneumoniae]|nr:phage protein [Streptococcus pneumoniae]VSV72754.1 phage protein [Streptococcus pneumoniae]